MTKGCDVKRQFMVVDCTRETVKTAVEMQKDGLSQAAIADAVGYTLVTMRRYLRLYAEHGPNVFIPQAKLN
jgi:response regulator of citrate/malate metabolism